MEAVLVAGQLDVETLRSAIGAVRAGVEDGVWVSDRKACPNPEDNHFVAFLKPETTMLESGVRFDSIVSELNEAMAHYAIGVGAVRVVGGRQLKNSGVMAQHYGVINAISRFGETELTEEAGTALRSRFADELAAGYQIMGGHQVLERFPEISPFALSALFSNIGSVRLAAGTYVCPVSIGDGQFLLINGFHPYQLQWFTSEDAVCVFFEGHTKTAWRSLRHDLVGATDPRAAAPGSFRRTLFDRSREFGLATVSQNRNGIHLSAGPLEGMVETVRFFGDVDAGDAPSYQHTCFGELLIKAGLRRGALDRLAENPAETVDGRLTTAFDLTEDLDAVAAVDALVQAFGGRTTSDGVDNGATSDRVID